MSAIYRAPNKGLADAAVASQGKVHGVAISGVTVSHVEGRPLYVYYDDGGDMTREAQIPMTKPLAATGWRLCAQGPGDILTQWLRDTPA